MGKGILSRSSVLALSSNFISIFPPSFLPFPCIVADAASCPPSSPPSPHLNTHVSTADAEKEEEGEDRLSLSFRQRRLRETGDGRGKSLFDVSWLQFCLEGGGRPVVAGAGERREKTGGEGELSKTIWDSARFLLNGKHLESKPNGHV